MFDEVLIVLIMQETCALIQVIVEKQKRAFTGQDIESNRLAKLPSWISEIKKAT